MFSIELSANAAVDGLPGVAPGSSSVGTFNRAEAVDNEFIDVFASGHPLVEGIFAHFDETPIGRVARFEISHGTEVNAGLVAIYKEGLTTLIVVLDTDGRPRTDWAATIIRRPMALQPVIDADDKGKWRALIRRLSAKLDQGRRLYAVGAVAVRPAV